MSENNLARWGYKIDELDQLDDWSSEWELVKKNGGFLYFN
jgi:hypothetical protein